MFYLIANNKNLKLIHLNMLTINENDYVVLYNSFSFDIYNYIFKKTKNVIIFLRQNKIDDYTFFGDDRIIKKSIKCAKFYFVIHDKIIKKTLSNKISKLVKIYNVDHKNIFIHNYTNIFNTDFDKLKIIPSLGLLSIEIINSDYSDSITLVGFTQRKKRDNTKFKSAIHNSDIETNIILTLENNNKLSQIYNDLL